MPTYTKDMRILLSQPERECISREPGSSPTLLRGFTASWRCQSQWLGWQGIAVEFFTAVGAAFPATVSSNRIPHKVLKLILLPRELAYPPTSLRRVVSGTSGTGCPFDDRQSSLKANVRP